MPLWVWVPLLLMMGEKRCGDEDEYEEEEKKEIPLKLEG